jgi:hypothetical protein
VSPGKAISVIVCKAGFAPLAAVEVAGVFWEVAVSDNLMVVTGVVELAAGLDGMGMTAAVSGGLGLPPGAAPVVVPPEFGGLNCGGCRTGESIVSTASQ